MSIHILNEKQLRVGGVSDQSPDVGQGSQAADGVGLGVSLQDASVRETQGAARRLDVTQRVHLVDHKLADGGLMKVSAGNKINN